jgi:rubrerythrin
MAKDKLLEALRMALQTELDGVNFYQMAAERTSDERGKKTFRMLAEEERKHFGELQRHYSSIMTQNKWAPSISLGEAKDMFSGSSPIFSEELKGRIKESHFEMSALSIGALLETNSIEFYRKIRQETDEPTARELFGKLENWEKGHLRAITQQLDVLKEDYWADQHFAPLY